MLTQLASWLRSTSSAEAISPAPGPNAPNACGAEFTKMWTSFVQSFADSGYMGRCTADPSGKAYPPASPPPARLPSAERVVAIGDLHGDFDKAQRAFRLAGLTDAGGNWAGGTTVAVQVGDILDRGDQEMRLLYFLEALQQQAAAAGGALHVINGNHESMNVGGNYRYATLGANTEMEAWLRWHRVGNRLRRLCACDLTPGSLPGSGLEPAVAVIASPSDGHADGGAQAAQQQAAAAAAAGPSSPLASPPPGHPLHRFYNPARHEALRPGGPVCHRFFAHHPTVLQVGSTVFVHGGLLPAHVEHGVERINAETQQWLLGRTGDVPPQFLTGSKAVVWARDYSAEDTAKCDCDALQQALEGMPGAKRMVVGHTIQRAGINDACGGRVLRVDVGMSSGCRDAEPEVLEIVRDSQVYRLSSSGRHLVSGASSASEAAPKGSAQQGGAGSGDRGGGSRQPVAAGAQSIPQPG